MVCIDERDYYSEYAAKVISRPGYPTRAAYKSYLAWRRFGKKILSLAGDINRVADVGGCFGFGLNAFVFHGSKILGHEMEGTLFEIGESYLRLGPLLFPHLHFSGEAYAEATFSRAYDITLMFDLLEHVSRPDDLLSAAARSTRLLIIKTPLESSTRYDRLVAMGRIQPIPLGDKHPDGHIHLFGLPAFVEMVKRHMKLESVWVVPHATWEPEALVNPERIASEVFLRSTGGKRHRSLSLLNTSIRALYRRTGFYVNAVRRGKTMGDAFVLASSSLLR